MKKPYPDGGDITPGDIGGIEPVDPDWPRLAGETKPGGNLKPLGMWPII